MDYAEMPEVFFARMDRTLKALIWGGGKFPCQDIFGLAVSDIYGEMVDYFVSTGHGEFAAKCLATGQINSFYSMRRHQCLKKVIRQYPMPARLARKRRRYM